ncbi:pentatricopeptide repeat-containing protein At2g36240-like [Aristolochia californica]|uniref:pentatricopeptide repeat-containing protein At2g36240-like n=1 Tax=Aristolochia californica TaxID=171875 RepID=UPI0035E0943E
MKKLSKFLSFPKKPHTHSSLTHPRVPGTENAKPCLIQSSEKPLVPLPTVSLCSTPQNLLTQFLSVHLNLSFTPKQLLHFLKNKLHHHPRFTQFDLQIFQWAQTVDSFRHDHSTYEWMVRTLAVTHRFNDLGPILDVIVSNPCPCSDDSIFCCPHLETIFQYAIECYCLVGKLDEALSAFYKMQKSIDGKPKVTIYNILINGFVRHQKHKSAIEMYDNMRKDKIKADVCTFNILISSYCRNSMLNLAMDVFKEMRRTEGCDPNVVTFNTLIGGFFRERKFKDGIGIAYEMLDLGCSFSISTCEILLDGLCREGKVVEAYELFIDLLKKEAVPSGFDCFSLVDALCSDGKVEKALEVLDKQWEKGHNPGVVACTTVIENLRNMGKIDNGVLLTRRMLKEAILPDYVTFTCLLGAMCDVGRTRDANQLRLLASKKGLDPEAMTYQILVHGFMRERMKKEGESIVEEMLDGGFLPDIATYNLLMDGLRDCNKLSHRRKGVRDG